MSLKTAVTCGTNFGGGGLGQHLKLVVEDEERTNPGGVRCYCSNGNGDPRCIEVRDPSRLWHLIGKVARYSPGWRSFLGCDRFDETASHRLGKFDRVIGFVGQCDKIFSAARRHGSCYLVVHAANSHVDNVRNLHARARTLCPVEAPWLNGAQANKTRHEYSTTDEIVVASEYTRKTFLERGFKPEMLSRIWLLPDSRFTPLLEPLPRSTFNIVYVGAVTVAKGVPVLLNAFEQITNPEARLTLVGGYTSPGMRKFMTAKMAKDSRITLAPGDPLPHLMQADVCVHPSWEDGWAYAPAEALACGVPTIVTQDTGMKELINEGINGYVVPTGEWEPILERIRAIELKPLRGFKPPEYPVVVR